MTKRQPPIDDARKALAEGEAIVAAAHDQYGLEGHRVSDGPFMRQWLRGELEKSPALLPRPVADNVPSVLGMIDFIIDREARGRWIDAGLALVALKSTYDGFNPDDIAADERAWPDFVNKHMPLMGFERANYLIGRVARRHGVMQCTKCGAEARCACECGAIYLPPLPVKESAIDRAKAAIAADPTRSDRAIAKQIGVSHKTVSRARAAMEGRASR